MWQLPAHAVPERTPARTPGRGLCAAALTAAEPVRAQRTAFVSFLAALSFQGVRQLVPRGALDCDLQETSGHVEPRRAPGAPSPEERGCPEGTGRPPRAPWRSRQTRLSRSRWEDDLEPAVGLRVDVASFGDKDPCSPQASGVQTMEGYGPRLTTALPAAPAGGPCRLRSSWETGVLAAP